MDVTAGTVRSDTLLSGYVATESDGDKVTGIYVDSGGGSLQSKSVVPTESSVMLFPDSGYYGLGGVTVYSISSSYIGSGVPVKASETFTPAVSVQTISSGVYLDGAQTILGDANLLASNIKSGVSIFGVVGNYDGGERNPLNDVAAKTISGAWTFSDVYAIGTSAFYGCSQLERAYFPICSYVSAGAFVLCSTLEEVSLPVCLTITGAAFSGCSNLASVNLAVCTSVGNNAFDGTGLEKIELPVCTNISTSAFFGCHSLSEVSIGFGISEKSAIWIYSFAFAACWGLKTVDIRGTSAITIASSAFATCKSLMSVNIETDGGDVNLYSSAFLNCENLSNVSIVTHSGYSTAIYANAFKGANFDVLSLRKPMISSSGLSGCKVRELHIYDGGILRDYACASISELTTVAYLPTSYSGGSIRTAFRGCTNLISFYLFAESLTFYASTTRPFSSTPIGGYSDVAGQYGSIFIPESMYDTYYSAKGWSYYSSRMVSLTNAEVEALGFT